jgi:N-acyl-D-aspartate/D-glutamate deacylase
MRPALLVLVVLLGLVPGSSAQEPSRYDVVIRGGRVLDGTGNPFFHADVAIDDGRIVLIGNPLSHAIRQMTSLPASVLRLSNRGLLREGYRADVTVFDPVTIRNRSTYARPHAYREGIRYVLINRKLAGKLAVDAGELTGALAGEVLTPRTSGRPTSN